MKTIVLILMLNTWGNDGKGALEKIEGWSSMETCEAAGESFKNIAWAQYYQCIEVK